MLRQWDAKTIRRLVEELPDPFRETIVLREINDLSYSEILSYRHGLFGSLGEISRFERVRGGAGRTRTSNQTIMERSALSIERWQSAAAAIRAAR